MTTPNPRAILEKRLGEFLGFEDETLSDILEHLLSIESEDDLLDYLVQLLGSKSEEIREFVKDIGRFQKGLPIESTAQQVTEHNQAATKQQKQQQQHSDPVTSVASQSKKNTQQQKKSAQQKNNTSNKPAPSSTQPTKKTGNSNKQEENVASKNKIADSAAAAAAAASTEVPPPPTTKQVEPPRKKYGLPPKGQPTKRNCGCFGTLHRPLTNCLFCGRISCEEEGYDFCHFCHFLVEEVKPPADDDPNSATSKAWLHKERLLRYDRESAQRTVVLDDQADYYSNQRSSWLNDDERAQAEDQDEDQRSNLHQRKKQVLNIAF